MNNSTMTLEQPSLPFGIKFTRPYPASQANVAASDIVIGIGLKLLMLILVFTVLKIAFNKPFFPFMWDQDLYYRDILMIKMNPLVLLKGSESYWSHNTLYSRLLGLLGLIFWIVPPYILAVTVNIVFSIIIAVYVVKIYYCFVEESYINPRIIYYAVLLSPILNAYVLLILRDIMIVGFFTMFIYYMLRNSFIGMLLVTLTFLALRPAMAVFCPMIYVMKRLTKWLLKFKLWWFYLIILTAIILTGLVMVGVDRIRVALMYLENMAGNDVSRLFGMGFITGDESTAIGGKTKLLIRLTAIDGIVVPLLAYFTLWPCYRRSNTDTRIFMAMIVAMHFTVGIVYLSTLKSFPARKLLMLIPIFYAQVFYYFNIRKTERIQKLRAKLLYHSQSRR